MTEKLTKCPVCGAEMASKAKTCPNCGAKNKRPVYKKWWFWVIAVFLVIGILGSIGGSEEKVSEGGDVIGQNTEDGDTTINETEEQQEQKIEYTAYDVTELFDAMKNNALNAQQTYKDQYVEITGYVGTIDSSGEYVCVGAGSTNYDYFLDEVQCYIKNDEQLQKVAVMSKDDPITVRGKIKSVGEVMGYSLDIDSIN